MRHFNKYGKYIIISILLFTIHAQSRGQTTITELHKIIATDVEKEDNFGEIVLLSGEYLFASAKEDDDYFQFSNDPNIYGQSYNNGAIYVYKKDTMTSTGWQFIQKILPPVDTTAGYPAYVFEMGYFISVDKTTERHLLIGVPQGDDNSNSGSGVAYLYELDTIAELWIHSKTLAPSVPKTGGFFGNAISKSNEYIAVRERPLFNVHPTAISIFKQNHGGQNNWGEIKQITNNNTELYFGFNITMTDELLFIGSFIEDSLTNGKGAVHIYQKDFGGVDNWGYLKTITSSDGDSAQQFGLSVQAFDTILVVGASRDNEQGVNSGAVYVFYQNEGGLNNWGEVKKIMPSDGASHHAFGYDLDLSGDSLLIVNSMGYNQNKGAAYVFQKNRNGLNNWEEIARLETTTNDIDDVFAQTVSIQGSDVIVSAGYDDEVDTDAGAFYTFDIGSVLIQAVDTTSSVSSLFPNSSVAKLHLYPNPTSGDFSIHFNPIDDSWKAKNLNIEIFDVSGRLVSRQQIFQNDLPLSLQALQEVPTGLYFVKMTVDNQLFTGKIMKY